MFIRFGDTLFPISSISYIDVNSEYHLTIYTNEGLTLDAKGPQVAGFTRWLGDMNQVYDLSNKERGPTKT